MCAALQYRDIRSNADPTLINGNFRRSRSTTSFNLRGGKRRGAFACTFGRRNMPLHGQGRSSLEMSNGRPLCPKCRVPMWTVYTDNRERDAQRSFNCPRCEQSQTARRYLPIER
jgi:hypothetical protein